MLGVHAQRHLVYRRHVDRLHNGVGCNVTEQSHLAAHLVRKGMLRAQNQYVGLQTRRLQLLDRVLRRLGLQLARGGHIGYKRKVYEYRVAVSELVAKLTDRLDEGQRLDIAHRTAYLGDDDVILLRCAEQLDAALDLVRDVGDHLHRLAQKLAATLLLDDTLIDLARSDIVVMGGGYRREALVVSQIEVGLGSILGNVALAVLIGVERSGVNVDIRVEFLDRDRITAGLKQPRHRRRDDTLSQRRCDTSRDEDVLWLV